MPAFLPRLFSIPEHGAAFGRESVNHLPQLPSATTQKVPESVSAWFANSQFGTELEPYFIAHDDEAQQLMDLNRIEWGTQFELARGVSSGAWTWDQIHKHISGLAGNNTKSAYKVQRVLRGGTSSSVQPGNIAVWKELDREQAAIKENRSRGLGLMGEWEGHSEWYDGQIQQLARLVKKWTKPIKSSLN
ncbi:hypothetical protein M413DRAFT_26372 [Hebeloma cylindrosporum]|uniref:Uncharacterized protein n=1 Tax=Hebeloma cylindrosporum TaxID=76867 RepID=A0A0C3CHX7_HEBCY|nr:hypothetical protein M413DRAFT_26372 [Hebeloma cylindrosporum h7]